jgi:hypothetical protein
MTEPTLSPTNVDVNHLDQAALVLEDIARFIEVNCLVDMRTITENLGSVTNVHDETAAYSFTNRATMFGGFASAFQLQQRNDSAYRAVQETMRGLVQRLYQSADATRTIAENYRTVEERNRAVGADIERALSGYELTPPGSAR